MSYYDHMFKSPPNGFKTYLLHVGQFGEMVIYQLDNDGKPANFVVGKAADVFKPLQKDLPGVIVTDPFKETPESLGYGYSHRWRFVADLLNKKGALASRAQGWFEALCRFDVGIKKYVRDNYREHKYVLTDLARAYDMRLDAEDAEKERAEATVELDDGA